MYHCSRSWTSFIHFGFSQTISVRYILVSFSCHHLGLLSQFCPKYFPTKILKKMLCLPHMNVAWHVDAKKHFQLKPSNQPTNQLAVTNSLVLTAQHLLLAKLAVWPNHESIQFNLLPNMIHLTGPVAILYSPPLSAKVISSQLKFWMFLLSYRYTGISRPTESDDAIHNLRRCSAGNTTMLSVVNSLEGT
jgi:hypothetical protein